MARDSPLHEGLSRLLPHAIDLLERNEGVPLAPRARFGAGPGRRSDGCIGTQSSGSRESQTKPRAKGTSDSCGKYAEGWDAPRRAPCIHFWKRPLGRLPHQVGDAHVAPQRGAELREALRSARLRGWAWPRRRTRLRQQVGHGRRAQLAHRCGLEVAVARPALASTAARTCAESCGPSAM